MEKYSLAEKPEAIGDLEYPGAMADIAMSLRVINRLIFETGIRLTGHMNINGQVGKSNIGEFRLVFNMEKLHGYLKGHPELTVPPTKEEMDRGYTAL
jgi:hypothetical protein